MKKNVAGYGLRVGDTAYTDVQPSYTGDTTSSPGALIVITRLDRVIQNHCGWQSLDAPTSFASASAYVKTSADMPAVKQAGA